GLAGGALLIASVVRARHYWMRAAEAPETDENLARRLMAIEQRVTESATLTQSLAIGLQEVSRQVDGEHLAELVRASVLVALQDLETARDIPLTRVAEVVADLRKSAAPSEKETMVKRATAFFAMGGGAITLLAGIVGLLNTTELWHAKRAPQITSFGPQQLRLLRTAPAFLTVTASDPDGDPLTYSYRASIGTIEARGSSVLWTPP